uniref:Uncharacterized protein n=1 Tax=Octopus bimaculoides TaxID=37653 RepID=A0A0L8IAB4_OCTBM
MCKCAVFTLRFSHSPAFPHSVALFVDVCVHGLVLSEYMCASNMPQPASCSLR